MSLAFRSRLRYSRKTSAEARWFMHYIASDWASPRESAAASTRSPACANVGTRTTGGIQFSLVSDNPRPRAVHHDRPLCAPSMPATTAAVAAASRRSVQVCQLAGNSGLPCRVQQSMRAIALNGVLREVVCAAANGIESPAFDRPREPHYIRLSTSRGGARLPWQRYF